MNTWLVLGVIALGCAAAGVAALRAIRCNWRLLREARRHAPLDGLDVSGATVAPVRTPARWPEPVDVTDRAVAAAYASLADDRALLESLVGELLIVAGGAALGAGVPAVVGLERWRVAGLLHAVAIAAAVLLPLGAVAFGFAFRARATRRWEPVAARYLARYRDLTAPPVEPVAAAVPAPRRGWLVELLGLRRRRLG